MTTLIFTVCDCEKIRGLGHEVSSTCEELSLNPSLFHSPSFSCSTLNGCSSSCLAHSTTPNLALPSSSNALSRQQRRKKGDECLKNENDIKKKGQNFCREVKRCYLRVNGIVSKRLSISLKNVRDVFIFKPYTLLGSLLYTVVLWPPSFAWIEKESIHKWFAVTKFQNQNRKSQIQTLTFPSPVLTSTSTAYTSCTSNSAFSWSFLQRQRDTIIHGSKHLSGQWWVTLADYTHFCWSVGFWMIVFSPSITCCLSWWDSMPVNIAGINWAKLSNHDW